MLETWQLFIFLINFHVTFVEVPTKRENVFCWSVTSSDVQFNYPLAYMKYWPGPNHLPPKTFRRKFDLKQDACYTGITRDAGADSFIPTVCLADW